MIFFHYVVLVLSFVFSMLLAERQCDDHSYICDEGNPIEFCNEPWALLWCPRTCGICSELSNVNYQPSLNKKHNRLSKYNYGQGGNVKVLQTLPANKNLKYSTGQGITTKENARHYISIGRDSLNANIPVFELGPSSKDFIIKQVDKILMTLDLMALKDNKKLQIAKKPQIAGRKYTNNKNDTNNKNITKAKDCDQLYNQGMTSLKNAQIFPYSCCPAKNVSVKCDQVHDGGRWTIIQSRGAYFKKDSRANFERNWDDYVKGFGKLALDQDGEYWIGLEALHDLTSGARQELFISLEDHAGNKRWAKYTNFSVGAPETNYKLTVGGYSGNAGNSLKYHNNQSFSTADKDNDQLSINCAEKYSGGWWFRGCQRSNLNGVHAFAPGSPTENGIIWVTFKGYDISLHTVTMKIRPVP